MRAVALLLLTISALASPRPALAREPALIGPRDGPEGRPHVVLDALVVPSGLAERQRISKVLQRALQLEARRVQWGAGRQNRITYRFYLERLDVKLEAGVLRVRCTALGRLPKGKSARSHLEFGGDPREPRKVIDHVLSIVARGVLGRLADLERTRRGRS